MRGCGSRVHHATRSTKIKRYGQRAKSWGSPWYGLDQSNTTWLWEAGATQKTNGSCAFVTGH
jgi:hypothetical protein